VFVVYTFHYFVFIDFILQFIISGIVTYRYVFNAYILSLLVSKNWGLRMWNLYFLMFWFVGHRAWSTLACLLYWW